MLGIVPTLDLKHTKRMADYTNYATAATLAMGMGANDFLLAFDENIKRQNSAAVESSSVAQVIIDFMRDKNEWTGLSTNLHGLLKDIAMSANLEMGGANGFPKSSNWLWKKIHVVKPNLREMGISVTRTETAMGTVIALTKQSDETFSSATTATHTQQEGYSKRNTATLRTDTAINTTTEVQSSFEFDNKDFSKGNGSMATMAVNDSSEDTLSPEVKEALENL